MGSLNRTLAALGLQALLLSGCSIPVRTPTWSFSMVTQAARKNVEIDSAFNTTIKHGVGLTLSVSGSYLSGTRKFKRFPESSPIFEYESQSGWQLVIRAPETCTASKAATLSLRRALNGVVKGIGGWPARGSTLITLVPGDAVVKRYVVSFRRGSRFALNFLSRCERGRPDEALWLAAMVGVHESTHAALQLTGRQPTQREERERVALGSEACLLLALSDGDNGFIRKHSSLGDNIYWRYQLADEKRSLHEWCSKWQEFMRTDYVPVVSGRSHVTPGE